MRNVHGIYLLVSLEIDLHLFVWRVTSLLVYLQTYLPSDDGTVCDFHLSLLISFLGFIILQTKKNCTAMSLLVEILYHSFSISVKKSLYKAKKMLEFN